MFVEYKWLPIMAIIGSAINFAHGSNQGSNNSEMAYQCTMPTKGEWRLFANYEMFTNNTISFDPMSQDFAGNSVEILGKLYILPTNAFKVLTSEYIVEMNLHDMDLVNMEPGAFRGLGCLQKLDLHMNTFTAVAPGVLIDEDLPSLKHLNLSFNIMMDVYHNYFKMSVLEVLDLSNNEISRVHEGSFKGLPKLKHLYLQRNPLDHVYFADWKLPSALMTLDLTDAKIRALDYNLDLLYPYLTRLMLGNNLLKELDVSTLKKVAPHLALLFLEGNPWVCTDLWVIVRDMDMHNIYHKSKNLTSSEIEGIDCIGDSKPTTTSSPHSNAKTSKPSRGGDSNHEEIWEEIKEQNSDILDAILDLKNVILFLFILVLLYICFSLFAKTPYLNICIAWIVSKAEDSVVLSENRGGDEEVESIRLVPPSSSREEMDSAI